MGVDQGFPAQAGRKHRVRLWVSFFIIYVVWGSTFLAIHLGVEGQPALLFASGRSLLAGLLLLAIALHRGERMPRGVREWSLMAFFAATMIALSNGPATFSLKHLPSNEVALLNSSTALWIAGLGTLGPKGQRLGMRSVIGLLLGFAGVALLVWTGEASTSPDLFWQVLTVAGCFAWACGTIVYRNTPLAVGPSAFNAWLMLLGGGALWVAGMASGEGPQWHWQWHTAVALGYLAVFGSALTYTAYGFLLRHARTDRVATFAYVNPAVATLLGWFVLGEALTAREWAGMAVVLAGVALVTLPSRYA